MFTFKTILSLCMVFLILQSCSNTKHLAENQKLYTGSELKINNGSKSEIKIANQALELIANRPKPNSKILGMRLRLRMYNWTGPEETKKRGIRKWLFTKYAEPPVFLSNVNIELNKKLIENRLQNIGYFYPKIDEEIKIRKRKAEIYYNITLDEPYKVGDYTIKDSSQILIAAQKVANNSIIKQGNIYHLENLREERIRITKQLRNNGYYYLRPDYFKFEADTANNNFTIDLNLIETPAIHDSLKVPYALMQPLVLIDAPINIGSPSTEMQNQDLTILSYGNDYNLNLFVRSILVRKGQWYEAEKEQATIRKLINLGSFQVAQLRYNTIDTNSIPPLLQPVITLQSYPKKALRFEASAITKSNNFTGPSVALSLTNRNTFGGSEALELKVNGGFETQFGQNTGQNLNSFELGFTGSLTFPFLLFPWHGAPKPRRFDSSTKFSAGLEWLNRTQFFTLQSVQLNYGFKWFEVKEKLHEFSPLVLNYVSLSNVSDAFNEILNRNNLLRRSFEDQFILGLSYNFTFNQMPLNANDRHWYFQVQTDLSGNTAQGLSRIGLGSENDGRRTIGGLPFSQFARFNTDLRYYSRKFNGGQLAFRLQAGAGFAYGNSEALPYVKQFFAGGVNSIRSFRVRGLGPGSYQAAINESSNFFDQTGDIKLELNSEYRFPIVSVVKGALFVDAGNIWNIRENEALPGGMWSADWLNQVAVGAGAGIRLDIQLFVIRLDLAIPIRNPGFLPTNNWRFSEKGFGGINWLNQNMIVNFAIGYPF